MDADVSGKSTLLRLAEIADEFECGNIASMARSKAQRASEGRFYVACIGQFKRGKSTLLNALIGEPLLPVGVTPVTSVPTVLRYGTMAAACVRMPGGKSREIPLREIGQYVSEEENPENVKGVAALEIFVPSSFLASGICLVDTPGVGSVFAGNTKSTHEFIPHMDAALVVIGADPPLSGDELVLIEKVARGVDEIAFVLNKSDKTSLSDRDVAVTFARRMLEARLHRGFPIIYEVSALEQLEHRGSGRDWEKLRWALATMAEKSGRAIIQAGAQKGISRVASQLLAVVQENHNALVRPLQDSERRITRLRTTLEHAAQAVRDLGALLLAEQQRLSCTFADQRKIFLAREKEIACAQLRQRFSSISQLRSGPRYRRAAMDLAQEVALARLVPWLDAEERFAETTFRRAADRFVQMGNDFLHRISDSGIDGAGSFRQELDVEVVMPEAPKFHFHSIERVAAPASPLMFVVDTVRFIVGSREGIQRDAESFLQMLLEVNSARVQSAIEESACEGRCKLESELQTLLHDAEGTAERALERARHVQVSGAAEVQNRVGRLDHIEAEIRKLVPSSGRLACGNSPCENYNPIES